MSSRQLKPAQRRALAAADIEEIIAYYLEQDATNAALKFIDELEAAIRHIQIHPKSGSPRYAHALHIPELRCWPCKHFPYLIFYREKSDCIDIWRVLHQQRDMPAWLVLETHDQ